MDVAAWLYLFSIIIKKDRAWRKTVDDLKKDKTCQFKIAAQPYNPNNSTTTVSWLIERDIPSINGTHASLDIAAACFSAFLVFSLFGFFIGENRCALLQLGALGLLLETARCAFFVDVVEPAEGMLLIVESLIMEANESDIGILETRGTGEQARRVLLMFLERLSHPSGLKKSAKQQ
ncbi:hypothetical protein AMTRI_Chr13g122040 [Amborella trichopoda]